MEKDRSCVRSLEGKKGLRKKEGSGLGECLLDYTFGMCFFHFHCKDFLRVLETIKIIGENAEICKK